MSTIFRKIHEYSLKTKSLTFFDSFSFFQKNIKILIEIGKIT